MDRPVIVRDSLTYSIIGVASNISYNSSGCTSSWPDNLSFPLGSVSLTLQPTPDAETLHGKNILVQNVEGLSSSYDMRVLGVSPGLDGSVSIHAIYIGGRDELNFEYGIKPIRISDLVEYPPTPPYDKNLEVDPTGVGVLPDIIATKDYGGLDGKEYLAGWDGNGLEMMAALAHSFGLVAYGDRLDQRKTTVNRLVNIQDWDPTLETLTPSRFVEVAWYESFYNANAEVYPVDNETAVILTVNAGETIETTLATDSWILELNPPTIEDWVEADEHYYDGTIGAYSVVGNDNRPITASQWQAQGGKLLVSKDPENQKNVIVTITGASESKYSPYRIAMSSGNNYNSLHITGKAVRQVRHVLRVATGVDENLTKTEVGVTVDFPFVESKEQAYSVGTRLAQKYCGVVPSLSGSAEQVEPTDILEHSYKRFMVTETSGDETGLKTFNADYYTIMSDFEETWAGKTMADFEAVWNASHDSMREFIIQPLRGNR